MTALRVIRRGIIVADDKTGELLASVKEALKYDELDAAGKVCSVGKPQPKMFQPPRMITIHFRSCRFRLFFATR